MRGFSSSFRISRIGESEVDHGYYTYQFDPLMDSLVNEV